MFKNFNIGARLGLGFGVVFVLFCALTIFSINRMDYLADNASQIHNHPLTVSNAVLRINAYVARIHRSMKDVVLDNSLAGIDKDARLVDGLETKIYADFDLIDKWFLGDRTLFVSAYDAFVSWKPIRDEVINLMRAGDRIAAVEITRGKGAQHVISIEHSMDEMIAFAQAKADEFVANAKATTDQSVHFMYLLLFFVVVAMIVFTSFLTRSITRPLEALRAATINIGKGELDAPLDVDVGGELGELARSIREMADNLSKVTASRDELNQEVVERQQAEDKLRNSEARIKLLLESTAEGIYGIDLEGECTFANQACLNMLQYKGMDDLLGKNMHNLIHHTRPDGSPYPMHACHIFESFQKGVGVHIDDEVLWRRDGTSFESEYWSYPIFEGEQAIGAVVTFMDITERRLADQQVQKLSQCIEQAGEAIVLTDRQGIIEYANPAFTMLTGYSAEESIGQTPRILKSGNQDAAFYKAMWETITSGKVWRGKMIDRKKDGSFYPSMLTISPIYAEPGKRTHYSHFVGIQSDITEIENLEQQFHQAQKMESIGTLVGGIAHDFNNMLAGMTGNLYLAKQQTKNMPDVLQKLANIEQIAFRASNMIEQLLTFARKDRVSIKPVPFTLFIKETYKLLRPSVPENIAMHVDVCSEMLQVQGDSTQLHQVLMNLVNNARDALESVEDGCITLKLGIRRVDDAFLESHADFKAVPYAHLSVQDNGCGIPEDQIKHLFEPFFTTKEQGKGTGLGLAMVHGAIKTHQGFIDVDSTEGEGTTFHIYIPLLEPENIEPKASRSHEVAEQGHGELILLVDDEACIVDPGAEVLNALGYQVLKARNGQQAVDIFSAHRDEIALIILDVVMPVMGGGKAAELIRQQRPDVKIIFSTGYDKNTQTELAGETVLAKPFSIIEMNQLIRQLLSG